MSKPDGGPAFPALDVEHFPAGYGYAEHDEVSGRSGMSLRDYFAGQAMAMFSSPDVLQAVRDDATERGLEPHENIARAAYEMADAMLAERSKE